MIEWDAAVNDYKWIQTSEIQQSPPRWEEKTESTGWYRSWYYKRLEELKKIAGLFPSWECWKSDLSCVCRNNHTGSYLHDFKTRKSNIAQGERPFEPDNDDFFFFAELDWETTKRKRLFYLGGLVNNPGILKSKQASQYTRGKVSGMGKPIRETTGSQKESGKSMN